MRVAIIGAGLAGLSCAFELEKYHIEPVIFESRSFIGDTSSYVSFSWNNQPGRHNNAYDVFKSTGLEIKPLEKINTVIWHKENGTSIIEGNLGYLFNYSRDEHSVKKQIFGKLKNTKVNYNEFGDYQTLSKRFDYVVISTGNPIFTDELGCWHEWYSVSIRGANVLGDFHPNTMSFWDVPGCYRKSYAAMTPYHSKKACIIFTVAGVNKKELENYWEMFLADCHIKYPVVEEFETHYRVGHAYPLVVDNILFAGGAAGSIIPFTDFAQASAILSGIFAARHMVKGESYSHQMDEFNHSNIQFMAYRNAFVNLGMHQTEVPPLTSWYPFVQSV